MKQETSRDEPLNEQEKLFLSVASLFEGTFSIDWIQELTEKRASQILRAFEKAVQQDLIKHGEIGFFEFTDERTARKFRSELTENDSEHYHERISAILIEELPETPDKAERLSHHLNHISNHIPGCNWLMKAAKSYRSKFRIDAAIKCYVKVLTDLSGRYEEGTDEIFCNAAIEYSKLNTARSDVKRVNSILEEAMLRARNLNNQTYQSLINMNFAKNKWLQSQYKSALKYFELSQQIAKELNDEKLLKQLHHSKTFLLYWQGLFKAAVHDYEKQVADVENLPYGRYPMLALMTVGTCYGQIGQVTQGIGMLDSIRRHCLEKGDIGLAAHSGIIIGATMLDIGHIDDALQHLVPSVEEAKGLQPDWTIILGELMLAYAYFLKGENKKCLHHLNQFDDLSNQVDVSVRPWPYLMELCWAIEEGRLPSLADFSIRTEVEKMIAGENVFLKGVAYRFKALLQKKEGQPSDLIIDSLESSIDYLEVSGHAIEQAKSRLELARIYIQKENREKALNAAELAYNVLSSLNENLIPDDLRPLLKDLSTTESYKEIVYINRELGSMRNSRDAIQYIISTANRISGAERGGIFLLEDSHAPLKFQLRASKNLTQDQVALSEFKSSYKLMAEVVSSEAGKVQALRIQDNPDYPEEEIILSSICVPIFIRGQISGVLYNDNRLLSNAFNESLLDILSSLTPYIALILENEKLLREKQDLIKSIEEISTFQEDRNSELVHSLGDSIIGESEEIKKVLAQISEIANTDSTVLILGETGVGKELVAKAIADNSGRKRSHFITLNCSALSEELMYSELFGHEKGSFTGADHRHIGRFEKAHQGTLFLDEIGDLPPEMQVRLLRVLETKEFERVGGRETIHSDFRLITATNRNLELEIKRKTFRSDLFYRINVFSIHVPPLRERKEDIPLLINYFLKKQQNKTGKISRTITEKEMSQLMQYHWPGNVRELKNCIERYSASRRSKILELLSTRVHSGQAEHKAAVTLKENEKMHIEWALERTGGKIHGPGGAAELLDIHPNTLSFRMKKLGITKKESS